MFEEQCFLHRNPLGLDALFRGLSRVGLLFNLLLPGFCLGVVTPSSCRMKGVQVCCRGEQDEIYSVSGFQSHCCL